MKKFIIFMMLIIIIDIGLIFYINKNTFNSYDDVVPEPITNEPSDPILDIHGDTILTINKKQDNCIPVMLYLYDDNVYELMTEYKSCKPGDICTMEFRYVSSIKGTYSYDSNSLLEIATLYTSDIAREDIEYIIEKNNKEYVILKGNDEIDEFLNTIDVNLDLCATANYNY